MLKSIVTGLGGRGMHWVNQIKNHPDYEVSGYVEPMEANRERAIDERGVPGDLVFPTLDEAIANVQADIVVDVTPPAVHHEVARKAFDAGLHVLGEKPLSDDYATAVKVVEWGKQAGVKHMITQNYRFSAQPRTTRQLLAQNLIGKPGQCDVRFYMPWADMAGTHYVTQPYMLINDMMVHHFDMIRYVLGADPIAVQAITWNQPWGWHKGDAAHSIVFEFPDGLYATHVSVGCAVGSQTSWNGDWRIEGPQGSITWGKTEMRHEHLHRTEEKIDRVIEPLEVKPGETAILDEFAAAIRDDREPECSAQDNLYSVAMVFAAIKSAQEERKVKLSELG